MKGEAMLKFDKNCCRHEAEVFKAAGAVLIRVEASFETRSKRGIITNTNDSTEVELDNYQGFDYILDNNGDYEELKKKIVPLAEFLKEKIIQLR